MLFWIINTNFFSIKFLSKLSQTFFLLVLTTTHNIFVLLIGILVNHGFNCSLPITYLHFAAVFVIFFLCINTWIIYSLSGLINVSSNVSNKNVLIVVKVLTLGYYDISHIIDSLKPVYKLNNVFLLHLIFDL